MARVTAIYGSPRTNGNSTALLKRFIAGVASGNTNTIDEFPVSSLVVSPCRELYVCREKGECPISDDFGRIARSLDDADVVAVSTPVMFYGVSAHLKAVIDRCQSFWVRKHILLKPSTPKMCFYFCVGATSGKRLFEGIDLTMRYFFEALNGKLENSILVRGVDGAGDIERISPESLLSAYSLGASIK